MSPTPDATRPFDVSIDRSAEVTRVQCTGELDIATADALKTALDGEKLDGVRHLVIDLTDVSFMDSTGLRLLIATHRTTQESGCDLTVVTGDSPAKRVLELTRMDEHIRVVPQLS